MTSDFETGWSAAISMNLQWMPSCLFMPKVSIWIPKVYTVYECQTYTTKHEYKLENNAITVVENSCFLRKLSKLTK